MPQEISQPVSWKIGDPPPRPAAGVPPRDPTPVIVHVTHIDLSFNNVFELVFMVLIAQAVIAIMIGIVVVAILLFTGNL